MIFDSQDHKTIVAALINKGTFPGEMSEIVSELKRAVSHASVVPPGGGAVIHEIEAAIAAKPGKPGRKRNGKDNTPA